MKKPNRRQAIQATAGAVLAATSGVAQADFALLRSLPVIGSRISTGVSIHKRRAAADYASNMQPFGGSLSRHGCQLTRDANRMAATDFDVLIIGSGYGASICAARLSMAKQPGTRIAILERGKEWIPGTFGDTLRHSMKESRFRMLGRKAGEIQNPVGLVNVMRNEEVDVLSGSGLGGTSLINASVAIRPDPECFAQPQWPAALQDRSVLDPYYDRASWELGAMTECEDASPKAKSQRLAAKNLDSCGANLEPATLTLTRSRADGPVVNRQGMLQRGCIDCGDCNSGCNVGAKNTLAMNYLPLARRFGAEMYTHTEVTCIEKDADHYRVHYKTYTQGDDGDYVAKHGSVSTRLVIVGAGSIGSNEILLRSQSDGLQMSERVGQQWTMNGDALGFVRKSDHLTNIGAFGAYEHNGPTVGPTIQTNLTYPSRTDLNKRVLIQDGSVSRAYSNVLGLLMRDMDFDHTLAMLGMGHDGSEGRVELGENGLGSVAWPGLKESSYRKLIRSEFAKVAKAHGGKYHYLKLFGDKLVTVHPLGGCAMADDPARGVVDDQGRLYDSVGSVSGGAAIHQGFYVADGSVIPRSIGCNPLLTISALAERIAEGIVHDPTHKNLFV